ncbi:MAG: capsular polysaccharide export protein, LipB/KpsS family [Yoonia sp.]|uniref:capsular polysaccharide export protein, LipB/KpsS family n=1 Tax=Yoonia sp. TaxID=2212373 RepID=UPI003EF69C63
MTIRLAVVSTAKNTNRILEDMQRQAGDALDVVFHMGDKTAPFKASSLSRMLPTTGTDGHLMEGDSYSGAAEPLVQSDDYFRLRDVFSDHMNRTGASHKYKSHPLKDQQDFHDYYHVVCDRLAAELRTRDVTHVLFFNVPHLSYDTALYHVASALGLPITIVTQSLFAGKFFSMADPADLGALLPNSDVAPYPIEKGSKPDLFYMQGIKQEREEGGKITPKAIMHLMTFLLLKRRWKALNPFYVIRLVCHMKRIYGGLPKWRDPFARFFHEDELTYFDTLTSFEDQTVDLSGDYIYFPLQLQPEMTTSALGGRFRDQAYAIERLAGILPEGVRILVKENPKQGGYMRGPMFFHRLNRIPSVTFLPSWADTHALTGGAKFVAAVTGTAGWEAIRAGTPALVFGKAWYRKLAGVVEWHERLTYQEVIATQVDHPALEQGVGALQAACHDGVVDRHYAKIVTDFDSDANDVACAKTVLGLITGDIHHTFSPES